MKTSKYQYHIFVRPVGSLTWTQHMKPAKPHAVPFRTGTISIADAEACWLVNNHNYCAIVVPIELPQTEDDRLYARLADGDTTFYPTPAKP